MMQKRYRFFPWLLALLAGVAVGRPEVADGRPVAPVFLHGDGGGGQSPLENDMRQALNRNKALAIIEEEFLRARRPVSRGPWLLDGFVTVERDTDDSGGIGEPWTTFFHPFAFDFWLPEWRIGVKFVDLEECRRIGYGQEFFIDYMRFDLIGAVQILRERFSAPEWPRSAFFYDPLPRGETAGPEATARAEGFLREQVRDFIGWADREAAAGRLPSRAEGDAWPPVAGDCRQEMRQAAADVSADPGIRLKAVEWLGYSRDEGAVPALADLLVDPILPLGSAAMRALGQVGSPEAVRALLALVADPERAHEVLPVLDMADPDWPLLPEAEALLPVLYGEMEGDRNSPGSAVWLGVCLRIDPERTVSRFQEAFRHGRMDENDALEYIRHCGPERMPAVFDFLREAGWWAYHWEDYARELDRLDSRWRSTPAFTDLVAALVGELDPDAPEKPLATGMPVCFALEEKIGRLDVLCPGWRNRPDARKRLRFLEKTLRDRVAAGDWGLDESIGLAMRVESRQADLLLQSWGRSQADDIGFVTKFCRDSIFYRRSKSIPFLANLQSSGDEETRETVLRTFARLGSDAEVAAFIRKGLRDPDPSVRAAAALAAGERRLAGAVPFLVRMLETERADGDLVIEVAEALARIGAPSGVRPVSGAMETWKNNAGVICQLVKSLTTWETAETAPAVGRFLDLAAGALAGASEDEKAESFLDVGRPEAGVEAAIRWAVRLRRTELRDKIRPFLSCFSPRHRGLAEAALDALSASALSNNVECEPAGPAQVLIGGSADNIVISSRVKVTFALLDPAK